jgi:hypothetical protein
VSECYFIVILAMGLGWDGFDAYIHAYNDEVENGNGVWIKIEIVHTHDLGQCWPHREQARNKYQHYLCSTLAIPCHHGL